LCESGGKGKSFLLKAFRQKCVEIQVFSSLIEFASDQPIAPIYCMRDIVEHIGEMYFPEFTKQDIEFHRTQPLVQIGGGRTNTEVSLNGRFENTEVSTVAGRDNITIGDIKVINQKISYERKQHIERVLTGTFKKELASLCTTHPAALIFDGYEHAPSSTADWIQKHLLNAVRDQIFSQLFIAIAGRPEGTRPKFTPVDEWRNILVNITTLTELKEHDVITYFSKRRNIQLEQSDLKAYYRVCKSSPLIMAQIADVLDTEQWLNP